MRTVDELPIMPMNSVLFPGAPATLYMHEERYRQMLDEAVANDGVFGVALLRAGREVGGPGIPHEVGTIARVCEVTTLPDGSSMVLAEGDARFRIKTVRSAMPVLTADVQLMEERAGIGSEGVPAVQAARDRFEELMTLVLRTMGAEERAPQLPDDPVELSYAIAANLEVSLTKRQELLEAKSAAERLSATLPMLEREIAHYRVLAVSREKLEELGIRENDDMPFSRS